MLLLTAAGIAVALEGPGLDDLAALLLDGLQGPERPPRFQARLLLELPLGRDQQIFVAVRFAFGDRPRPIVLVDEIGAARMGQEDFEDSILDAKHQQSGAESGHGFALWLKTTIKARRASEVGLISFDDVNFSLRVGL